MRPYLIYIFILLFLGACSSISPNLPKKDLETNTSTIIIDLDEELQLLESQGNFQGENTILFDEPIYIGDNDEVAFKGEFLKERSPIHIQIGQKEDILFNQTSYRIKSIDLQAKETLLIMKDKDKHIFLSTKLLKERQ